MARITVEDCIENVDSRFELIMLASRRARELASGAMPTLPRDKDKNPVIALREIAEQTISLDQLRENVVLSYQRIKPVEDQEEDLDSILAADAALGNQKKEVIGASRSDMMIGGKEDFSIADDDDDQLIG